MIGPRFRGDLQTKVARPRNGPQRERQRGPHPSGTESRRANRPPRWFVLPASTVPMPACSTTRATAVAVLPLRVPLQLLAVLLPLLVPLAVQLLSLVRQPVPLLPRPVPPLATRAAIAAARSRTASRCLSSACPRSSAARFATSAARRAAASQFARPAVPQPVPLQPLLVRQPVPLQLLVAQPVPLQPLAAAELSRTAQPVRGLELV